MASNLAAPNLVPHVLYEPEDSGILWIRFNRPERMNATAEDTAEKVAEYMKAGDADPTIRVIVLTGVGRAFCAGNDMKDTGRRDHGEDGVDGYRQHFAHYFRLSGFEARLKRIVNEAPSAFCHYPQVKDPDGVLCCPADPVIANQP